jgi:hypothetical protein
MIVYGIFVSVADGPHQSRGKVASIINFRPPQPTPERTDWSLWQACGLAQHRNAFAARIGENLGSGR